MNKNRKGFTIVELVIVIAIIAILAAVLIPTFASLIAKANVSADTQLVRNLNTALTTEKAGGENNKTMNDALKMAKNAGYDIDRIVSKSGNNIGWDSKNDRFVLIDANNDTYIYPTDAGANAQKVQNAVDYFVIYKEIPSNPKYSIYLSKDATLADGTVTVSVGFDAGENENVTAVNYTSDATQNVIIRTNSTNTVLTVSAKNSTVKHYDVAGKVLVTAVASESYHEFGEVQGNIELADGRVVMEAGSKASAIKVTATKAEIENGATIKVDSTAAPTVAVVVTEEVKNALTDKGGKIDASNVVTDPTVIENMSNFAGGLGTEDSPYLIATVEQWNTFAKAEYAYSNLNWSVISDLDFTNATTAYVEKFNGKINFNGHTVKGLSSKQLAYGDFLFKYVVGATIENLNVYNVALIYGINVDGQNTNYSNATTLLKNINSYGALRVEDNNTTPFAFWIYSGKVEFNNCDTYMVVSNTGNACAALYLGTVGMHTDEIKFVECDNYGMLVHTAGYSSMLISNGHSNVTVDCKNSAGKAFSDILVVSNCHNYGAIIGVTGADLVNGHSKFNELKYDGLVNAGLCITKTPTVINEYNGTLALNTVNGAASYQITYTFWETAFDNNGEKVSWGSTGYSFKTNDVSSLTLNTYKFVNRPENATTETIDIGDGKMTVATINGEKFYVFNPSGEKCPEGFEYTIDAQPFVSVIAYDAEGRILDMAVYKYADTKVN